MRSDAIKYLVAALVLLLPASPANISTPARAQDDPYSPATIRKYIETLHPKISAERAEELSIFYSGVTREKELDPKLLVAIAFQENSFRIQGIHNNDIGHMQLNYYWQVVRRGKAPDLTIEKLDKDWQLNVSLAVEYLEEIRSKYSNRPGDHWWAYYNAYGKTPRKEYEKRIEKHLKKLEAL